MVEDDADARASVCRFLAARGYVVEEAESCEQAARAFLGRRPDVVVLDHRLPDGTALSLLPRLREIDPEVPLLVLTGHGSIELAVEAVKAGAENFLVKPVELPTLALLIERLAQAQHDRRAARASRRRLQREPEPFLGPSAAIRELAEQAARVAQVGRPVLLLGETGTGKGILASWLHRHGPRSAEPLVDLNCAGLPRDLVESELFGHARGAFTGAVQAKPGLFEVAHRGTIFLDEVGDLDPAVQPKLLKVVEENRLRRLGETSERWVDVQLVLATHRDLERLVSEGRFREDLYFRINTLTLRVPPLRERRDDIAMLAESILARLAAALGRPPVYLADAAVEVLEGRPWPGNIRELRNALERAVLLHGTDRIEPRHLGIDAGPTPRSSPKAPGSLAQLEWERIEKVLGEEQGNVPRAARRLGLSRSGLYRKLKRRDPAVSPK